MDEDEYMDEKAETFSEDEEEEGFQKGYEEEEKVSECAECGAAVKEERKIVHELEGEEYVFCSKACADEFEETMAKGEG